jgi:hypothetical protein
VKEPERGENVGDLGERGHKRAAGFLCYLLFAICHFIRALGENEALSFASRLLSGQRCASQWKEWGDWSRFV